jgi:hypothetical protein
VQQPAADGTTARMWSVPVVTSPRYGHPALRLLALALQCAPWGAAIWCLAPAMSHAADYVVAPPPAREAYLHVGVGPGGPTLCRTLVYATPVARPAVGASSAGASSPAANLSSLSRPWHPVSYRLLYSLVGRAG